MVDVKRGSMHPRTGFEPPPPPDDPVWGETAKVGTMTALLADMVLADDANATARLPAVGEIDIPCYADSSPTLHEARTPAPAAPPRVASPWPMAPPPMPVPPSRRRGLVVMTLVVMAALAACAIAVAASGQ